MLEIVPTALGTAAIVPALLVLWLVVSADKRPEPPGVVLAAFLLGAGSVFLLRYARLPFEALVPIPDDAWLALLIRALTVIAMPEETLRVAIIGAVALWARAFDEPMDGVVYGAAVGLGFAAYENLAYLIRYPDDQASLAVLRGVLTVPLHGALGVIAGGYIARARFGGALGAYRHDRLRRAQLLLLAWLVPVVLHALFDFCALSLRQGLVKGSPGRDLLQAATLLVGFGAIAIAVRLGWRLSALQKPTERTRIPPMTLGAIWAGLVVAAAAGFVGTALIISEIRHGEKGSISMGLVALGGALLVAGAGVFRWGGRRLFRGHATYHQA